MKRLPIKADVVVYAARSDPWMKFKEEAGKPRIIKFGAIGWEGASSCSLVPGRHKASAYLLATSQFPQLRCLKN